MDTSHKKQDGGDIKPAAEDIQANTVVWDSNGQDESNPAPQNTEESEKDGTKLLSDQEKPPSRSPIRKSPLVLGSLRKFYNHDPLLCLTIIGVISGILIGIIFAAILGETGNSTRKKVVSIIGFPGSILLNLLKMMVLPLIFGSMVGGMCSLHECGSEGTGKLARYTLAFFGGTTVIAVIWGLIVVLTFRPGSGGIGQYSSEVFGNSSSHNTSSAMSQDVLSTILGVILKMFPPNIVQAAAEMNILGVIVFAVFFGAMLSSLGPTAAPMIQLVHVFNEIIMKMVMAVLNFAPFGIASLIASQICSTSNLTNVLRALGLYMFTVVFALAVHALLILPAIFFALTRKNPYKFTYGLMQALATAFGTDSSSATLPITMLCCEKNLNISPLISKFVLPLGATVNMNGTALYEALTVIFIAQLHGVPMSIGQILVIAFTSTLAAVGAAAIPSAGLVTMVMVLQSVGLDEYVSDLSFIFTIDWALDRVRTMVNVLGDAMAAGVIQHLLGDQVQKLPTRED